MAGSLSPGQKEELDSVFKMFDSDSNGVITTEELKRTMETLGFRPTAVELDDIISAANGYMNWDNFVALVTKPMGDASAEEDSLKAFNCYDKDGDKAISKTDLQTAMFTLFGDKLTDDDLNDIFNECDRDRDNKINFEEFNRVLLL